MSTWHTGLRSIYHFIYAQPNSVFIGRSLEEEKTNLILKNNRLNNNIMSKF